MTDIDRPASQLVDDLDAVLAGLGKARRALAKGEISDSDHLWQQLERCALRMETIDHGERAAVKPMMLALLDELEQTIAVFGSEHRQIGEKLRSASKSLTAGAAYRQANSR